MVLNVSQLAAAALAALFLAGGCRRDLCAGRAPAFEVEVQLERESVLLPKVRWLRVRIVAAGLRSDELLEVGAALADGKTAFSAAVGEAGRGGFSVDAEISAIDELGRVVARGELHRAATGDACNFFSIVLGRATRDGGADARAADGARLDGKRRDGPDRWDARAPEIGKGDVMVCPACSAEQICCWHVAGAAICVEEPDRCVCDPATGAPCKGLYPACCKQSSGTSICKASCP
jgi:hypothetical protein